MDNVVAGKRQPIGAIAIQQTCVTVRSWPTPAPHSTSTPSPTLIAPPSITRAVIPP